ncbi:hypothetical protein RhiirB3_448283 [Rhizophagus irregularis]|nr:hypothetical protein RhiirB3_448283 [Rhizophagus irregularis]
MSFSTLSKPALVKEWKDPKEDVNKSSSPSPATKKKRKSAPISKASNSQSPLKTTKKQPVATSLKTISTVMIEYIPMNKNLV